MDAFDTTKTRKTIKLKKKKLSPFSIRWIIQLVMVVIIIGGASLRNLMPGGSFLATLFPELQGFCPFGPRFLSFSHYKNRPLA